MSEPTPKEPLRFQRIAQTAVWGGRALAERLGVGAVNDGPIGETWELSDVPGAKTRVVGGHFEGSTLEELLAVHREALLGDSRLDPNGRFPLLVKFIEARQDLSVQVHPDDGALGPGTIGKTEAWCILPESEPTASVVAGLRPGTERKAFVRDAGSRKVLDHLLEHPVRGGDCLMIHAGIPHSIRAGTVLLEVQQTSDVTLRMYDWDRVGLDGKPRDMHVKQALEVINFDSGPLEIVRAQYPVSDPVPAARIAALASCPYFRLYEVRLSGAADHDPEGLARVLVVVGGSGQVEGAESVAQELRFGDTLLLPAHMGTATFTPGPDGLHLIEAVAL
ncbi:MAG: class I mannose-6-phosphate isomerase [Planctomycetes bacterium]|nr:class I mannose-6-phosphate isomerase [Planctomycetota bacterium]